MFGSFNERMDSKSRRRLVVSVGVSALIYAGLIVVVVALAGREEKKDDDDHEVEVTFVRTIEEPPPPPPPPPEPPKVEKLAPGPVGPAAPAKPAPPRPPKPPPKPVEAAPTEMPNKPAPAAETPLAPPSAPPSEDPTPAGPTGPTDPNGGDGPGGDGPPGSNGGGGGGDDPNGSVPVILPAGATAPKVIGSFVTSDDYPRAARAAEIEGLVKVKVVVKTDGSVEFVKWIKSDPNFDDAVRDILKRLKYKPAMYNGRPIAVFQNLTFPFEIE